MDASVGDIGKGEIAFLRTVEVKRGNYFLLIFFNIFLTLMCFFYRTLLVVLAILPTRSAMMEKVAICFSNSAIRTIVVMFLVLTSTPSGLPPVLANKRTSFSPQLKDIINSVGNREKL